MLNKSAKSKIIISLFLVIAGILAIYAASYLVTAYSAGSVGGEDYATILVLKTYRSIPINITINSSDFMTGARGNSTHNITITLPTGFVFVNNSNKTNIVAGATGGCGGNLTNSTPQIWVMHPCAITNDTLLFNVTSTSAAGVTNISIKFNITTDGSEITSGTKNITVAIRLNDSLKTVITLTNYSFQIYNRSTSANGTTLSINEETNSTISLNINNSGIGDAPLSVDVNQTINITAINVSFGSSNVTYAESTNVYSGTGTGGFSNQSNASVSWKNNTLISAGSKSNGGNNKTFQFAVNATHPGNYTMYVNITFNSSLSEYSSGNTSVHTYTLRVKDNVVPEITTFSCTPTSVIVGETVTCSCTAADNYYSTSEGFTTTVSTVDTGIVGTQTETCTAVDGNGNQYVASATYTVNAVQESTTGGGGAGSGYTGAITHNTGELTSAETTITSEAEENIKFITSTGTTAGTTFRGTVDAVTEDSATLTIVDADGNNKEITIAVGSTGKLDLDADDVYDMSIKLDSVTGGKAKFLMKEITETVPLEEREGAAGEEEGEEEEIGEEEVSKNLAWLWITLGVIVVIAVVIFFLVQKKKPMGVFLLTLFAKNGKSIRRR